MRKLAIFSAGFGAAAALFVYLLHDVRALWIAGACLVLAPISLLLGVKRISAVLLGLCAGLVWCFGYQQIWLAPVSAVCDTEQRFSVTLLDDPSAAEYGTYVEVEILLRGRTFGGLLYGEEDLLEAHGGDVVSGSMLAQAPQQKPDGDWFPQASGHVLCLYLKSEPEIKSGEPSWSFRVRRSLQNAIDRLYDGNSAAFLRALLTGDRSRLTFGVQNDLSVAGLSHAVAVSGMHVSMLLAMVALCCGYHPRLTALFGIPVIVAFAMMTGASPSVCRAAIMQTMLLLAPLVRRENDPITTLGAAALLLLLQNPWVIANVSFQLSFAALSGLILFSAPIQRRILQSQKHPGRALRVIASSVSASLGASALTMPLVLYYFNLISLVAVIVNLLLLWAVTVIFTLGLLSCFLGTAGLILAVPVDFLAKLVLGICRLTAKAPFAAAYPQNPALMIWALAAYGVVFWFLLVPKSKGLLAASAVLAAGFAACVLWGISFSADGPVYRVLDVGQGQATLYACNDFLAVVDCGGQDPENAGEQMARTLHSRGQSQIDALIVTHYDADHAGGAAHLLSRVKTGVVILPDVPDESGIRQSIEDAAAAADTPVVLVSALTELEFSQGKLTVYPPLSGENDNNRGICVLASALEYDILITGDLDRFMEMRLLSQWELPQVELLVAGHHGAGTSTSQPLLDTVRPQLVAISVGADNPYGHPSDETLTRLQSVGAAVYRTDELGTLVFQP